MLKTNKLSRNYKFTRETTGGDTVENQSPSLVTEDQFNTVKAFIDSNKATVDKILSIDESTLSEDRLSRVKAIKMVMENNGSYEKYRNNNVGNQESANQVYKTEEKNTSKAVGLANYELDHDSKQKTALIERVKTLRGLKSDPEVAFSSIQQLQLEVAERLLGPQAVAAEFDIKPIDTEKLTLQNQVKNSPIKTKVERVRGMANRVAGWNKFPDYNTPSSKGEISKQVDIIQGGSTKTDEGNIRVNGTHDKFDKLIYDKKNDLEDFSSPRERTITENIAYIKDWSDSHPRREAVIKDYQAEIAQLKAQKKGVKNGLNIFDNKYNQERRDNFQRQIDQKQSSLDVSIGDLEYSKLRISQWEERNLKLTSEIADFKKELDKKYRL